mmetsp:Transcript_2589/g.4345  ORF Transcript_2589/g.4345 Transcript_2589/m.4345 type:complete len:128 (-) Transcript_2589:202-585(-)
MSQHYMVYDLTPVQEQHLDFIKLGIAPINAEDVVGKGYIDRAQEAFDNYQYMIAMITLSCVVLISLVVYYCCKIEMTEDEELFTRKLSRKFQEKRQRQLRHYHKFDLQNQLLVHNNTRTTSSGTSGG